MKVLLVQDDLIAHPNRMRFIWWQGSGEGAEIGKAMPCVCFYGKRQLMFFPGTAALAYATQYSVDR